MITKIHKFLKKLLTTHWLLTSFVMAISSLSLVLSSANIFIMFRANILLISENGFMALKDGAAEQFFSICFYGIISVFSYVIFKACEKVLVEKLLK